MHLFKSSKLLPFILHSERMRIVSQLLLIVVLTDRSIVEDLFQTCVIFSAVYLNSICFISAAIY